VGLPRPVGFTWKSLHESRSPTPLNWCVVRGAVHPHCSRSSPVRFTASFTRCAASCSPHREEVGYPVGPSNHVLGGSPNAPRERGSFFLGGGGGGDISRRMVKCRKYPACASNSLSGSSDAAFRCPYCSSLFASLSGITVSLECGLRLKNVGGLFERSVQHNGEDRQPYG